MVFPAFDREILRNRLEEISTYNQALFGMSCCERMMPNYSVFHLETGWGNLSFMLSSLELIWEHMEGNIISDSEIENLIKECKKNIPDLDDFDSLYASLAQEISIGLCHLLSFMILNETERIVNIATLSISSIDCMIQEVIGISPESSILEEKILYNPLMQNELSYQDAHLSYLEKKSFIDKESLRKFKSRCKKIPVINFNDL